MKPYRTLLSLGAMLLATASLAHPRISRELLQKFWPDAQSAVAQQVKPPAARAQEINGLLGQPLPKELDHAHYFTVQGKNGAPLGMLMNFDPPGVGLGVAVDRDHQKIIKVVIYKQKPGVPKLDVGGFLQQFAGKTASDPFVVGKDINPVPGAAKESQVIATDVKAALLLAQKRVFAAGKTTSPQHEGHHPPQPDSKGVPQ